MSYSQQLILRNQLNCPHCWDRFPPDEVLWVSQHAELMGDARLGSDHQQRFLPSRFTPEGDAIDSRGFNCSDLACPRCHLLVPRCLLELKPFFLSILGAPASGKSYFLACMTWTLRRVLSEQFAMNFADADPATNRSLNEYEELLFLNDDPDHLAAIRKTELQGELYDTVDFGNHTTTFPRPFVFSLRPSDHHPNRDGGLRIARAVCMYDNAGEHFLPGQDTAGAPVTRHLALSEALFFLFDPTQDTRFRQECRADSADPQLQERSRTSRQETILHEAADRIRRYTGLAQNAKHDRPLVVVVTKFDAWSKLAGIDALPDPIRKSADALCGIDHTAIHEIHRMTRGVLAKYSPEIVAAAEGFANEVLFLPCSAIGRPPELNPETGMLGIRPRDIQPSWVEIPFLYTLSRWTSGLVPFLRDPQVTEAPLTSAQSKAGNPQRKAQ